MKTHSLFSLSRRPCYNHPNNHHHSLSNFQFSIVACWRVALPRGAHTISRGREDTCSAALKPFWTLIFFKKFKAPYKLYLLYCVFGLCGLSTLLLVLFPNNTDTGTHKGQEHTCPNVLSKQGIWGSGCAPTCENSDISLKPSASSKAFNIEALKNTIVI